VEDYEQHWTDLLNSWPIPSHYKQPCSSER